MNPLFPDKIWNYKNFNMGTELDIAGEFIYDGINVLNQMNSTNDHASLAKASKSGTDYIMRISA